MKGSPLRELGLVLAAALCLLWPLIHLTGGAGPVPDPEPEQIESASLPLDSWVEFRFSHPPVEAWLVAGDQEIWRGAGGSRGDADARLTLSEGVLVMDLHVRWPEGVEQGYAEVTVEPGSLPAQTAGVWGRGQQQDTLEFQWTTQP